MFAATDSRQKAIAIAAALTTGVVLAVGFLPVAVALGRRTALFLGATRSNTVAWAECVSFPLLAGVFWLSLPRSKGVGGSFDLRSVALPTLIAFLYGWVQPGPGLFFLAWNPELFLAGAWVLFFAPLGEEWLFRGWLYEISDRLSLGRFATVTNPLPVAVWISAIAFSLWHLQNWGESSVTLTLFQVAYTLPAGLWLGYLR